MESRAALAPEEAAEVLDSAPAGIGVCDRELRWVVWNRAMESFTGLAADDVLGERAPEVAAALAGDDAPALLRAVCDGIAVDLDEVALPGTGGREPRWLSVRWSPQHGPGGGVAGAVVAVHDVTARRRGDQQALRLAAIPRESPNPVLECDPEGNVLYANPATRHVLA